MDDRRTGPLDRRYAVAIPAADFPDRRQTALPFRDARHWHGDYRYTRDTIVEVRNGRRHDDPR